MQEEVIRKIADHFGLELQKNQLIEELAELIHSLCKLNKNGEIANVVEEIADVKIMLEQVIYLLGVSREVEKAIGSKINRTIRGGLG